MKYNKIKKLDNEITNKSYEKSNGGKSRGWNIISIFFQVLNVGISFFFVYLFLINVVDEFPFRDIIFGTISVIVLGLWEFLKRNTLRTIALKYFKKLGSIRLYLTEIVLAAILIIGSGFMAIHGAKSITDKTKVVEKIVEVENTALVDTVSSEYDEEIEFLKEQIILFMEAAKVNKRTLYRSERERIAEIEAKIETLKKERDKKIEAIKIASEEELTSKTDENQSQIILFIIMVIVIESFILIGVVYVANYDYRVFNEVIKSDEYILFKRYNTLLDVIYQQGSKKKGDKVYSSKELYELGRRKVNNLRTSEPQKYISYLKTIGIIKKDGRVNKFFVTYEDAKQIVKTNFNY